MWFKYYYTFVQSQQQKVVKPPLDRDKLFTALYTSHSVQPSWEAAGLVAHPYIVSLLCCSTIDYNHHHPLQLSAASEDVGEICPPDDGVSMMVPLPTSNASTFHSNPSNSCLSLLSQEEFFILLDDDNDEVDEQWILYQCIISSITESDWSRYASTRVSDMFLWEVAVGIHTMWSRDLSVM